MNLVGVFPVIVLPTVSSGTNLEVPDIFYLGLRIARYSVHISPQIVLCILPEFESIKTQDQKLHDLFLRDWNLFPTYTN